MMLRILDIGIPEDILRYYETLINYFGSEIVMTSTSYIGVDIPMNLISRSRNGRLKILM